MTEQSTAAADTTQAAADATSGNPAPASAPAAADPAGSTTSTALTSDPAKDRDKPADATTTDTSTPKAPEKYEFKAPDGITLEPGITAEFETIARAHDLSQEDAQAFTDLGVKLVQKLGQQQLEAHAAQVSKWLEDSKADKEFGGERFDASIGEARKAVERFGSPELKTLLEQTGLGNHPEVVRLFHRIGNAIAEDAFVNAPSGGGSHPKSAAQVLFDHPTSQAR